MATTLFVESIEILYFWGSPRYKNDNYNSVIGSSIKNGRRGRSMTANCVAIRHYSNWIYNKKYRRPNECRSIGDIIFDGKILTRIGVNYRQSTVFVGIRNVLKAITICQA